MANDGARPTIDNGKFCSCSPHSSCAIYIHLQGHERTPKTVRFTCDSNLEMLECEICEFGTDLKVKLYEHVRIHRRAKQVNNELENIFKCSECCNCGFQTRSALVMTKHVTNCDNAVGNSQKQTNVPETNWFECAHKTNKKHISRKHVKSDVVFKCTQCSFKTKQITNLKLHKVARHANLEDIKWFKCRQCFFKSKQKSNLKSHISRMHVKLQDANWFECADCPFKSKQRDYLKRHILSKHVDPANANWFQCAQCVFKTKYKRSFETHISTQHLKPEDVNWFKCGQCSFKTKLKFYLKSHVSNQHLNPEDVNWFGCEHCDFKTKQKSNLKKHIFCRHLGPEEVHWFECADCSFKTKHKNSLKIPRRFTV